MKFCEHNWKYKDGYYPGLVYYGKVLVYGCHDRSVCKWCGKIKSKIVKIIKVYGQKELEEYYKQTKYVKPPIQLEFI